MRTIIFTRGASGSGKTTFLKEKNLLEFTITPDNLRLFFQSPIVNINGETGISQLNEKKVWELLLKTLEERMQKGEFIIIDATHTREDDFDKYKKLINNYRYRAYVLDFSNLTLEETLSRNNQRTIKKVPDSIVKQMYVRAKKNKIPSWLEIIKTEDFDSWLQIPIRDFSNYKKIHHIGDLQGCYTVLEEYFSNNSFQDDELYIFIGDYIDRGIENAKTIQFVLKNFEKKNFIFLEGNHEINLWEWANDKEVKAKEFSEFTKKELDNAKIDKAQVRNFCRRLNTFVYYKYHKQIFFITHGGIAKIPENARLIASDQFIRGYGQYREYFDVASNFKKNSKSNQYSIHGHRNNYSHPTQINSNVFNLEGKVEFGGNLRIAVVDNIKNKVTITIKEIKNNIFKEIPEYRVKNKIPINFHNATIIDKLRNNKYIIEKKFPEFNISSFNFTNQVFYNKIWNRETVRARGLFVNTNNYEIVARSYEKFFNINERKETQLENLKESFIYPIEVYIKENGYLGMLGYDAESDHLIYTSKSSLNNDFVLWFKELFLNKFKSSKDKIKDFLKKENVSLIFEVILPQKDPHIINYKEDNLILLDIVKRDLDFYKLDYKEMIKFANEFKMAAKNKFLTINNEKEFLEFYEKENNRKISDKYFEGFVLEAEDGLMVKLKLN